MILSFSVFKDKIENGTKSQTIRPYNERQFKRHVNAKKFQLYWHNPRNGGKLIKEVDPPLADAPRIIRFDNQMGDHFDRIWYSSDGQWLGMDREEVAQRDGFASYKEMQEWFYKSYGKDMYKILFMLIRWSRG